jgi:hypothetical protein
LAFQRGEDSELAVMGALFWAEHIDNMRGVNAFVQALGRGAKKKGSKKPSRGRRR